MSYVSQGGEGFERPELYGAAVGLQVVRALATNARPVTPARITLQVSKYEEQITNLAFVAAFALGAAPAAPAAPAAAAAGGGSRMQHHTWQSLGCI